MFEENIRRLIQFLENIEKNLYAKFIGWEGELLAMRTYLKSL